MVFFLVKIIEIEHMLDVLSSIITICMIITLIEKIIKFNPISIQVLFKHLN
jgi:hypothetical protein